MLVRLERDGRSPEEQSAPLGASITAASHHPSCAHLAAPPLQGKRVRAPSQAAINAAILAAQRAAGTAPSVDDDDSSDFFSDEEEDEDDEGSSEGEEAPAAAGGKKAGEGGGGGGQASGARLQTNRVLTPEEFILGELAKQAGGVSVHTQATWPGAAMLVLTKARRAAAVGWVAGGKANPVSPASRAITGFRGAGPESRHLVMFTPTPTPTTRCPHVPLRRCPLFLTAGAAPGVRRRVQRTGGLEGLPRLRGGGGSAHGPGHRQGGGPMAPTAAGRLHLEVGSVSRGFLCLCLPNVEPTCFLPRPCPAHPLAGQAAGAQLRQPAGAAARRQLGEAPAGWGWWG